MARREITVELLTETIINEGLKAAKQLLADRQHEISMAVQQADAAIAAAQTEKERLQQQQSQLQTLLIGAVKRASQLEAIPLTEPAQKAAKTAKRTPAQTAADRQTVLAALPKSKADATSAAALADRLGMPRLQVSQDLKNLGDKVARQGERSATVYWAKQ